MCGFSGFFFTDDFNSQPELILNKMAEAISHRGPNDYGAWFDKNNNIGLSHCRLSIIDLSQSGHQPMLSKRDRYVLVYNGEVYNHQWLRDELAAEFSDWSGHSDTEILLAGFEVWGVQKTIEKVIGMFAFAVWDKHENTLTLGRDRLGEKPLYYARHNNSFIFGSELKALKQHPDFNDNIYRDSINLFLRHGYIPAPYSIYEGVYKLEPGTLLTINKDLDQIERTQYWSVLDKALEGKDQKFAGNSFDAVNHLEKLVSSAISQQMLSDVPLGAFLSGGVDSSTVVSLMQAQSSVPVKTFTIGFSEEGYNEAKHAKSVACHLGTDHTELYVSPDKTREVIPLLPDLYDEPFADPSQIPTYLVSKLAKEKVTVSLSGDAGDELFCGYSRYTFARKIWESTSKIPWFVKNPIRKAIQVTPPAILNSFSKLPFTTNGLLYGDKIHKGANLLNAKSLEQMYLNLVSFHCQPGELVKGGTEPITPFNNPPAQLSQFSDMEKMMLLDSLMYLPDDILTKLDRAAMGVSLETRVPFLDHRVVEFAFSLPMDIKIKDGVSKWPLKELLYRYVPREIVDRPKMGFGVPISDWLKGPLKEWCEELLDEKRLEHEGFFHTVAVRKLWVEHISGTRNWSFLLWNILMFQAWLEHQKSPL